MSFSTDVKEELIKQIPSARHCRIAELSVFMMFYGNTAKENECDAKLYILTEHKTIIRKCFTLLKKTFNIEMYASDEAVESGLLIRGSEEVKNVLQALKMWNDEKKDMECQQTISSLLLKTQCCKRAYIRAMYLCCGSMSDPQKGYHLEFVCPNEKAAQTLLDAIDSFDMEAKLIWRKEHPVVYLKEGSAIVTLLNVMEAHVSLMDLENQRILKDIANHTNRLINCEVANSAKTIGAASGQIDDIRLIDETIGLSALPEQLRELAILRLENTDMPLKELGENLTPPLGKSGVNHRMRKISEIAEKLRGQT